MDISLDQPQFEFIFGIGPSGITPFEYELAEKSEGQEILIEVKRDNLAIFFEHLHPPITHLDNDTQLIFLKINIQKIAPAGHREVVKALAEVTAHGHGCGCGCQG
jgi:hypothetical protein